MFPSNLCTQEYDVLWRASRFALVRMATASCTLWQAQASLLLLELQGGLSKCQSGLLLLNQSEGVFACAESILDPKQAPSALHRQWRVWKRLWLGGKPLKKR